MPKGKQISLLISVSNPLHRTCYQCGVCGDKFVSRGEVESHVVTQHQAEMVAGEGVNGVSLFH